MPAVGQELYQQALAKYASEGRTVGIDISVDILQKATKVAAEAKMPTQGPGSIIFEHGNVLEGLPYSDDTFDIVYCSQMLVHLPPPNVPRQALVELRRVLKPGGILATRDGVAQHFYPKSLELDRLWVQNASRAVSQWAPPADP